MARSSPSTGLAAHRRRYRELAERVADIGFIAAGSIAHVPNRCGKANCRCHADPPQLHGPYYQWTGKVKGKTVTRRLSPEQARLYQEWIDNDRALRDLVAQMRQVAAEATKLIMEEAAGTGTKV